MSFTENGVIIDMDEVRKVVEHCDVFTIGFRIFPQRLIVDTRSSESEGPMIEIVEPVSTVEERFFWLGKRRPSFNVPQRFTFFVWPHSIRYFEESGLAQMILKRVAAGGDRGATESMQAALDALREMEAQAVRDAVTGRHYHTVWAAAPSG